MRASLPLFLSLVVLALGYDPVSAQARRSTETVARLIDQNINARLREAKVPASPLTSDAAFLRRVYLDLTGRLPAYEKTLAFLADSAPNRRAQLIDDLLATPEFARHLSTTWTNILLAGDVVSSAERQLFQSWLASMLQHNQGWDKIVHEMLTAEGESKKAPAVVFTLACSENNKVQANLLAAATTRHFLGIQLQCAECHNHPFTSYKQADFWGVAAFFGKVQKVGAKKNAPGGVLESAKAPAAPKGKKNEPAVTGAVIVLPGTAGKGAGKVVKARFLEGAEPPLDVNQPYRPVLAQWVVSPSNSFFARATVNRLWAHLFGRGFINPVDDMHADNDLSHPELLQALAEEFRQSDHDIRHLLRCICNSQAYQRSSRPVQGNAEDKTLFSHMAVKVLTPEMLYDALTQVLDVRELKLTTGKTATIGIGGNKNQPAKLAGREQFVKFFRTMAADGLPTDYTHGIPQALTLMNDPELNKTSPAVEQLVRAGLSREQAIERLSLRVLARRPTGQEVRLLSGYLAQQSDVARGYAGVLWILLNTQEFVLNR